MTKSTVRWLACAVLLACSMPALTQETPATPEPEATAESDATPVPGDAPATPPIEPTTILDLASAQRMAVEQSPTLKASETRIRQALERVKQARAAWYPNLFVVATATNTWISENDYELARKAASNGYWTSFALGSQARLQSETLAFAQILGNNAAQLFSPNPQFIPLTSVPNTERETLRDLVRTSVLSTEARHAIDQQIEQYSVSVVADWILFNGFDRKYSIAEARFGTQQTEASFLESHRLLLDAVARAYYSAQLARENIAIAEADQRFNQRQLDEAKARRRVGTGSLSDELNFEVRVNAARAALISARLDYNTSVIALAELMALPDANFPPTMGLAALPEDTLEELNPPQVEPLVEFAKTHRPDLTVRELDEERAGAIVGRARAPFYPQVNTQITKDAVRIDNAEIGQDDFSATAGINVSYEIFAGGRNIARLRETKAFRSETEQLTAQLELEVASDVRSAAEELKAAQDRLVLERANAAFVQRNRDLVEKEYAGGVGSLVRLNEAQRDLVAAQANLAFARVQLQAAWHALRTATAETVQPYRDETADIVRVRPAK